MTMIDSEVLVSIDEKRQARFTSDGSGIAVKYPGGEWFLWNPDGPNPAPPSLEATSAKPPTEGRALPRLTNAEKELYRETFGVDPLEEPRLDQDHLDDYKRSSREGR